MDTVELVKSVTSVVDHLRDSKYNFVSIAMRPDEGHEVTYSLEWRYVEPCPGFDHPHENGGVENG